MNRSEVIDNIGTIAKSGTREFFEALTGDQSKDAQADRSVRRRFLFLLHRRRQGHADHPPRRPGTANTACAGNPRARANTPSKPSRKPTRGTEVDAASARRARTNFSTAARLRAIIRKYSDHITLPIVMKVDENGEKTTRTKPSTRPRRCGRAPRTRSPTEEYDEFYKHVAHDFEAPLAHVHSRVEGKQEYTSLLYIPATRAVRPVGPGKAATASSCTCSACSSWTTPSS